MFTNAPCLTGCVSVCFPVIYLNYGAFSSYAPIYDSSSANIGKDDSDLLLSTYADETGVQYAKRFVQWRRSGWLSILIVVNHYGRVRLLIYAQSVVKWLRSREQVVDVSISSDACLANQISSIRCMKEVAFGYCNRSLLLILVIWITPVSEHVFPDWIVMLNS